MSDEVQPTEGPAVNSVDTSETVPHTVTEEDMQNNPELADAGIKTGDEIELPVAEEAEAPISAGPTATPVEGSPDAPETGEAPAETFGTPAQ